MDWDAEGLLDGCEGHARESRRALLDKLHGDGVPLEELRRAVAEDRLALLPVERLLASSEARYSAREIAQRARPRLLPRPPARARARGAGARRARL